MWKVIKFLFIVTAVTLCVLAVTGHKIGGKTVVEYVRDLAKPGTKDTITDLRQMVGEAMKAVGQQLSDDATDKESEELKKKIKEDLEKRSHFYDEATKKLERDNKSDKKKF